jgi:DNA polymerase elongation subunit (family B)
MQVSGIIKRSGKQTQREQIRKKIVQYNIIQTALKLLVNAGYGVSARE